MIVKHLYEAAHALPERVADSGILGRLGLRAPEFEARIQEAMGRVEQLLHQCAHSAPDPRISLLTGHLAAAGGKRLRPLLVLLGAEFGEPERDGVIAELVHVASLYHDDVMDAAAVRHGVPSVNARWGEKAAVLGGDWLLARAAQLAAALGPDAVHLNAQTAGRLVSGQLRELCGPGPGPGEDPVEHYFRVCEGKTAALLSMSLGIGALQAVAPAHHVSALAEYGEQLGIAFQIADDLLDLAAPQHSTGKEQGNDLLAGVPSLPVLLALAGDDPRDAELRDLLSAGAAAGPAAHRRALELFRRSPAPARAEALMHDRLERARTALEVLPALPARRALAALCGFVAQRTA
ncbi:polyprenyl synthetase family protein [Streptomyces sp. NPDC058682]|uniref:polyprenyl synthetase family protein n=1 Tax=Streptomyces sp. NPDC058682 TaxID=3346596 RepID=UPI0036651359